MTEKEIIGHIKATEKSPKTFGDYTNYLFFIAPIAFIAIGFSMIYNYVIFNSALAILFDAVLFIALGVSFAFFIYKRLSDNITFVAISSTSKIDIENIADRLKQNFKLNRIEVTKDLDKIVAFTKITAFSWGEQLTLILDRDRILINSRPSAQPLTILKDRLNIKKLKELL